ncbi:hypothetical protein Lal_00039885 [Lupinus albus]|nr:hypothetical protein Lal_00039885 [Lupinus albus]
MDLRGKNDYNWQQKHDQWIQIWNNRENYVVNDLPNIQPLYHTPNTCSGTYKGRENQCASSNVHYNPMQTINDVYIHYNEMIDALSKLLPTTFSNNNYQAPPTHHFDMPIAPEFQQPYHSQTQTNTHPQTFTQQTPAPQQQPFQFQSFGILSDYSISHQFRSSSHYQETLPSMFGTTSTTPSSAFNSQQYYQPTMPTQVEQGNIYDEDEEDDEDEDEEEP